MKPDPAARIEARGQTRCKVDGVQRPQPVLPCKVRGVMHNGGSCINNYIGEYGAGEVSLQACSDFGGLSWRQLASVLAPRNRGHGLGERHP